MMLYPLVRRATLISTLLLAAAGAVISQEFSLEELVPGFKERAVKIDIVSRVLEQNQEEVWNSFNSKVTIPGRPVGMKLVGNNIVVAVQFTPYRQKNGQNILVAQGQIWVNIPDQGIHYQTTMETIPLEYGERIFFFPLGSANNPNGPRIEIQIELHPYTEEQAEQAPVQPPSVQPSQIQPSQSPRIPPPPVQESTDSGSGRSPAVNE
jgi:hypothetical protein